MNEQAIADLITRGRECLALEQVALALRGVFPQLTEDERRISAHALAHAGHDVFTLGVNFEHTPESQAAWEKSLAAFSEIIPKLTPAQVDFSERYILRSAFA